MRWTTCLLVLVATVRLGATTIVLPSDGELVDKSPLVIVGDVIRSNPVLRGNGVWTETTIAVRDVLKGTDPGSTVTIREVGGTLGNRRTIVFGTPHYAAGEHVLVFLWPTPRGDYQTRDLFVGKFVETRLADGSPGWLRDTDRDGTLLLDRDLVPISGSEEVHPAHAFEQFVRERARGGTPAEVQSATAGPLDLTATLAFTLIDEPTIYRWFAFDDGAGVGWKSVGTQRGYADGGIDEIEAAIAVWDGYAGAKIDYRYDGPSSAPPGGLDASNGINEILFEDPLDEIDGSWNGSTGVVGRGGFNEVRGPRTWTSELRVDPAHPKATFNDTWEIVEGNLVIQNGIAPSTGIDSNRLTRLLAHELGHTLGIGHSPDSTALMYANLRYTSPSLAPDDEDAARWLYPNGPYPPPPSAPRNLEVVAAIEDSVTLRWTDTASDEDEQLVYLSGGGSAVARVAMRVGPNVTEVTIGSLEGGTAYKFFVVARNGGGESEPSNTVTVTTPITDVAAAFRVEPATGIAGQTRFAFVDSSAGRIVSRIWTFGDGWSSESPTPSHIYAAAGHYTVTLVVTGGAGQQSTATRTVDVDAPPDPLVAAFDAPETIRASEPADFTNRSSGSPTHWLWSFGDGSTSDQPSPSHTYATPGQYVVTLTVGDGVSSSSVSRAITVRPAARRLVFPVAARIHGANLTTWRTEMSLFNGGVETARVQLEFLPGDDLAPIDREVQIAPNTTRYWSDVVSELFGLDRGAGAIAARIETDLERPRVACAVRISTASSDAHFGQFVNALPATTETIAHLTGLRWDASARTNVGFVNLGDTPTSIDLLLRNGAGEAIGSAELSLGSRHFRQASLRDLFPVLDETPLLNLTLNVESDPGVVAYASVVDNRTQDPSLVTATAPIAGPVIIPVIARTRGVNGTDWRSEVSVFNPGNEAVTLSARFLDSSTSRTATIAPRAAWSVADAIGWMGGDRAGGSLLFEHGASAIIGQSRLFNTRADGGTYGQSVPMRPVSAVDSRFLLTGVFENDASRTNLGFVNVGDEPIEVVVELYTLDGVPAGGKTLGLPARAFVQVPLPTVKNGSDEPYSLRVVATAPTLFAWASVIDNISGDPTWIPGQ